MELQLCGGQTVQPACLHLKLEDDGDEVYSVFLGDDLKSASLCFFFFFVSS